MKIPRFVLLLPSRSRCRLRERVTNCRNVLRRDDCPFNSFLGRSKKSNLPSVTAYRRTRPQR